MKKLAITIVAAGALAACSSAGNNDNSDANQHSNNEEVATPSDHACDHMVYGPETAVTATADPADAPMNTLAHGRWDITVPGDPSYMTFETTDAGHYHFFFDEADATVTISDTNGAIVTYSDKLASVPECDEVIQGAQYNLEVGTYSFELRTAASDVSMVSVPPLVPGEEEMHLHDTM